MWPIFSAASNWLACQVRFDLGVYTRFWVGARPGSNRTKPLVVDREVWCLTSVLQSVDMQKVCVHARVTHVCLRMSPPDVPQSQDANHLDTILTGTVVKVLQYTLLQQGAARGSQPE